ncbi:ATP-binding protein [Streptomyces sp. NPDC056656]|uniref:ATP-binding protein n=1 Tax=Streptomyces sp. NPDC056656 TaxID=3345895 RepID=UPI0036A52E88
MLRVGVMDNDPDLPDPLPCATEESFGRGLFLVQALAADWGRYPVTGRKVVRFELSTAHDD